MADGESPDTPLERHLFAAGGDARSAEAKLLGLLSDADLEGDILEVGDEEGEPAADDAPVISEGESEEEESEEEDESPLGEEEDVEDDSDDDPEVDDDEYEYEYVDAEGNVIEDDGVELHTVPVDGKEHEVSLEDLKSSYSFRAHNTRKSQELAEERKAFEVESEAGRQSREVYGQRLEQLEQALVSMYPQEPDWDTLEREDPARFATESAKWSRHQRKLDALTVERTRVHNEEVAEQSRKIEEFRAEQSTEMLNAIPEWSDEKVHEEEMTRLHAYAGKVMGFSDEEIAGFYDHRAVVALRKAMLFDELQVRGRKIRKKGKKPSAAALKPGVRRRRRKAGAKRSNQARQRLSQSGSVKDAEAALFEMLGDDA